MPSPISWRKRARRRAKTEEWIIAKSLPARSFAHEARRPPFVRRWRNEARPGRERRPKSPHRPPPPDDLSRGVRDAPETGRPRGTGDGRRSRGQRPGSDRLAQGGAALGPEPSQGEARSDVARGPLRG